MSRLRPVHNLSKHEAALATAIAIPRIGDAAQRRSLKLKYKIEAYWRERGFTVVVDFIAGEMTSNTLNGLPMVKA